MSIHILSPEVIDQIAAGEVVERPAHMVKELVENSLDAGASEIEVEYDEGGKSVFVKDNGGGIGKSDLSLALARHGTSKISDSEDLWKLSTYGFRGEALASIASVSEFTLVSRVSDDSSSSAFRIKSEFGNLSDVSEAGGAPGTQVQVENLFQNIPARLKFLKSDSAEGTQIKNVLKALALAYPHVTFRVRTKSKQVFYWPAAETKLERASQVLEKQELYWGEYELEGMKAEVALAPPNVTTGNSKQIWLFAQNRWVQDRSLQTAVMDGFRSLLMHGEFPYCIAWVTCPSDQIDINIHPTKSQVKFLDNKTSFRVVQRAVRGIAEKSPWVEPLIDGDERGESVAHASPEVDLDFGLKAQRVEPQNLSFTQGEFSKVQYASKDSFKTRQETKERKFKEESELDTYLSLDEKLQTVASPVQAYPQLSQVPIDMVACESKPAEEGVWSKLHVLGQAHETYIVTQNEKSLILIDQHAAHERVAYESLMKKWGDGDIDVQSYLIPLTIDLDPDLVEALMSVSDQVSKLGVSIEQFGPESVGVSAAPTILREQAIVKALTELARSVADHGGGFALENTVGDVCASMACHSVIRAGKVMSHNEMKALLEAMDEFPMSSFCPHGRPVYVEYPFSKVEKDFGRIV